MIRAFTAQDVVQVEVSDESVGIPLENYVEVFEDFCRVERLTANHDLEAGLGLAICKEIIGAHGGQIWIQNREVGTTISSTLPVTTKEDSE
jgi:two-component system, OmpR family, sensor histidine kinase VicK